MSHNPSNYQQNYQNYYQSAPEQYDDYYEDETQDLKPNYDDIPPDLQVPNSKLYTEGYPDDNELYATNTQFVEPQQQVENTNFQYRHEYNVAPNDYYYTDPQPHYHHRTRVPKTQPPPIQSTSSFRYLLPHSLYPSCPLATSTSQQGTALNQLTTNLSQGTSLNPTISLNQGVCLNQGECSYIPKAGVSGYHVTGRTLPKTVGASNVKIVADNYTTLQDNIEHFETFDQNQRTDNYEDLSENERKVYQNQEYYDLNRGKAYQTQEYYDQNQVKAYQTQKNYVDYNQGQTNACQNPENFGDYCNVGARAAFVGQYGANQYIKYKGKRFAYYDNKVAGKSANMKKYPVTVKTPKYVNKNQVAQLIHKRPSALCLPQVTQPDPGLVKRKCKTQHNLKKPYDQFESSNPPADTTENYSYSAHQMHSEGDMNQNSMAQGLDSLLDQFENKMGFNENTGDGIQREENLSKIKEISKFLKPRVPSSIRAKQERMAKMKSSLNMSGSLQPKMKLSLDKLLNRLQKCELSESAEKLSVKSSRSKNLDEKEKISESKTVKHKSFNYETLTRKLSPRMEDPEEESESIPNKPSTSLTTSLDHKKSSRLIRPLDDNCAIDLHRSKSYIVDLIDRALSKELGTVPRGKVEENMTPKRAVTTISRHRQTGQKELCYEVTAALTDSFISNATAPPSTQDVLSKSLNRCESDSGGVKKLCNSFSEDVGYINQLKQLRWGHIRHIQHEARKLADLEEFLEKCGEIEY